MLSLAGLAVIDRRWRQLASSRLSNYRHRRQRTRMAIRSPLK